MKLAEAILLGSTITYQTRGSLFGFETFGFETEIVGSCALGSALLAVGLVNQKDSLLTLTVSKPVDLSTAIRRMYPWIMKAVSCPCDNCSEVDVVQNIIIHLNDHHAWERERTAEWVASVEQKEEVANNQEKKGGVLGSQKKNPGKLKSKRVLLPADK